MIEAARNKHDQKEKKPASDEGYSMQVAARRSGVSPHLIRMWERRYAAVEPRRTPTGRRVYDEAAIERLRLLNAATQAGHNIGSIAGLPLERLQAIVRTDAQAVSRVPQREGVAKGATLPNAKVDSGYWIGKALDAVRALDAEALRIALDESLVALGRVGAVENVVAPLMEQTGEMWRNGTLRIVHEHLASAGARSFLGALMETPVAENAPLLLVTTPVGQVHEIGALMAAATAVSEGWRALYLGPSLPAEEVALAVRSHDGARALALSFVYPPDDLHIAGEIKRLGEFLPKGFSVIAGGRAAGEYAAELDAIGARRVGDLQELRAALEVLRHR
jgi:MerR family transcriptional regulator, light-induced transcriptional regulator